MPPRRAFLEAFLPERREVRPHREGIHVLHAHGARLPAEESDQEGREAIEVAAVGDAGVRADPALVLEMA